MRHSDEFHSQEKSCHTAMLLAHNQVHVGHPREAGNGSVGGERGSNHGGRNGGEDDRRREVVWRRRRYILANAVLNLIGQALMAVYGIGLKLGEEEDVASSVWKSDDGPFLVMTAAPDGVYDRCVMQFHHSFAGFAWRFSPLFWRSWLSPGAAACYLLLEGTSIGASSSGADSAPAAHGGISDDENQSLLQQLRILAFCTHLALSVFGAFFGSAFGPVVQATLAESQRRRVRLRRIESMTHSSSFASAASGSSSSTADPVTTNTSESEEEEAAPSYFQAVVLLNVAAGFQSTLLPRLGVFLKDNVFFNGVGGIFLLGVGSVMIALGVVKWGFEGRGRREDDRGAGARDDYRSGEGRGLSAGGYQRLQERVAGDDDPTPDGDPHEGRFVWVPDRRAQPPSVDRAASPEIMSSSGSSAPALPRRLDLPDEDPPSPDSLRNQAMLRVTRYVRSLTVDVPHPVRFACLIFMMNCFAGGCDVVMLYFVEDVADFQERDNSYLYVFGGVANVVCNVLAFVVTSWWAKPKARSQNPSTTTSEAEGRGGSPSDRDPRDRRQEPDRRPFLIRFFAVTK